MHTPSTGARALAIASGTALVAAAAWLTIDATGGPYTPHATLVAATSLALVAGAIALAHARRAAFAAILIGLVCAEGYSLLGTAERLVAAREAAQAPVRATETARRAAAARLATAQAAAADAASAIILRAAERDCRANCRALLEQAKADAATELEAARRAHAALPPAAEVAPLAVRLGLAPWALDLVAAALGSIAANGLGAALISFAVHARRPARLPAPSPVDFRPVLRVADAEIEPEDGGSGPGNRASDPAPLPANVIALHPVVQALRAAGGEVASNRELARLMRVTEGESSKRWREVERHLEIVRDGRQCRIRLRRATG